jgi:hypothetical protein
MQNFVLKHGGMYGNQYALRDLAQVHFFIYLYFIEWSC